MLALSFTGGTWPPTLSGVNASEKRSHSGRPWISVAVRPYGFGVSAMMIDDNLVSQAGTFRDSIEAVLRWLCKGPNWKELELSAIRFLLDHAQHRQIQLKEAFYEPEQLREFNYTLAEQEKLQRTSR
jgi:hypothetical protein